MTKYNWSSKQRKWTLKNAGWFSDNGIDEWEFQFKPNQLALYGETINNREIPYGF